MADSNIEFKGSSFTLSVVHLKTTVLADIRSSVEAKVAQAPDFFHLVPIIVAIDNLNGDIDYLAIKTLFEDCHFNFVGFTGSITKEQRAQIRSLNLSFVNSVKNITAKPASAQTTTAKTFPQETTINAPAQPITTFFSDKVHRGQVRSGQQIYAKGQNLVIIGSVSAGAEVIADGNIHVYGTLRGRAIAGATGHNKAQIYCQSIEAELLSISGNYWLSESIEQHWGTPAYIQLTNGELTLSKLI